MTSANQDADRIIDMVDGKAPKAAVAEERRAKNRYPYEAMVAVVLVRPGGERSRPTALRAKNLSVGGVCVSSREPMEVGTAAVLQLVRSDGQMALVGGMVRHCHYLGEMSHEIGFEFGGLPEGVSHAEFLDEDDHLRPLDPLMGVNIRST